MRGSCVCGGVPGGDVGCFMVGHVAALHVLDRMTAFGLGRWVAVDIVLGVDVGGVSYAAGRLLAEGNVTGDALLLAGILLLRKGVPMLVWLRPKGRRFSAAGLWRVAASAACLVGGGGWYLVD